MRWFITAILQQNSKKRREIMTKQIEDKDPKGFKKTQLEQEPTRAQERKQKKDVDLEDDDAGER
jgi:hypothetical protein